MTSESQKLPSTETSLESESSDNTKLSRVNQSQGLNLHRAESPLPGNRPIADNDTEDIDDMLGYLD